MTLQEFIKIQTKRLKHFQRVYSVEITKSKWPTELEYHEWIEQENAVFEIELDNKLVDMEITK